MTVTPEDQFELDRKMRRDGIVNSTMAQIHVLDRDAKAGSISARPHALTIRRSTRLGLRFLRAVCWKSIEACRSRWRTVAAVVVCRR